MRKKAGKMMMGKKKKRKTTVIGEVSDVGESRISCVLLDLFQALLGNYHGGVMYIGKMQY